MVKFSRKELLDALNEAPSELKLEVIPDQVTLKARRGRQNETTVLYIFIHSD